MLLFSHKSQVVCAFPSLHFASNGLAICVKSSRHLRQIAWSFDAVYNVISFILFHVLIASSKMLTPFKIL